MKHFFTILLSLFLSCLWQISAQDFNLPGNGSEEIADCAGSVYDSGGADGEYGNSESSSLTINPGGSVIIQLEFISFNTESGFDNVNIYDGASTADPLIMTFTDDLTGNLPEAILSSGNAITIELTSDGSATRPGFQIDFICVDLTGPPSANASSSSLEACPGSILMFNDQSAGNTDDWAWDFGDGNTSTEAEPTHSYDTPGTYQPSVVFCNVNGCAEVFDLEPIVVYSPEDLFCNAFSMPVTGSGSAAGCGILLYDSGGDDENYTDNSIAELLVTTGETSVFELNFLEFITDGTDNLVIYDGPTTDYPILDVFAGDLTATLPGPITTSSNSILLLFTSNGFTNFPGFIIEAQCIPYTDVPTVTAAALPPLSCGGEVQFLDISGGAPDSWSWDFGDGNTSDVQNPLHTYTSPGEYTATLEVCNPNGCAEEIELTVEVYDAADPFCTPLLMVANNENSFQQCDGILVDSGGPDGVYTMGENSLTTIGDPAAAALNLSFLEFDMATGFNPDNLIIFDGADNSAPVLGTFNINNPPPTVLQSSTGFVTIQVQTNFNTPTSGFVMVWEAIGSGLPPVASFTTMDLNPPYNWPVQFTDETTEGPGSWAWDFGDGDLAFEQNPAHIYTTSGENLVSLTASNCVGSSTAEPIIVDVQLPPFGLISPDFIDLELENGETVDTTVTLSNFGSGDLVYEVFGTANSFAGIIQVLVYDWAGTGSVQYDKTIEILEDMGSNVYIYETSTFDPTVLESELNNMSAFLIVGKENQDGEVDANVMTQFAPVLQEFAEDGGTVLFTGTSEEDVIFNTGLWEYGGTETTFNGPMVDLAITDHPVTLGVETPFFGTSGLVGYDLTNDDRTVLLEQDGVDLISLRPIGNGYSFFFGFNYFLSTPSSRALLQNAIRFAAGSNGTQWLYVDPTSGVVGSGDTEELTFTFDAVGAPGGVYTVDILVYTNDPDHPILTVTCQVTITGDPVLTVIKDDIDFGNVVQFTEATHDLVISNTGADTLFVTNITTGDPNFTVDQTEFWVFPGLEEIVTITFGPDDIASFDGIELTLFTNAGDEVILMDANATGAPIGQVNPSPIEITLDAGTTGTLDVDFSNIGAGDLIYNFGLSGGAGFLFDFFLDTFNTEFSWQLVDSEGNIILSIEPGDYPAGNTQYQEMFEGLEATEEYTLILLDTFGDGALDDYLVTDLITGEVVASGDWPTGDVLEIPLGSPTLWLTGDLEDGVLPFPDGNLTFTLDFDATTLLGGVYETVIIIETNDPLNPTIELPVTMTVVGIPEIEIASQDDFEFENLLIGLQDSATITVFNPGTDNLIISDVLIGNDQYSTDNTMWNIAPGDSVTITVTFTPNEIGDWPTTITLVNNDEDLVFEVNGSGQGAPAGSVTPGALEVTLLSGDSETLTFDLTNSGEGNMEYTITLPGGLGPGFDFTFLLDSFNNEYSWQLEDSEGNIVLSVNPGDYPAGNTEYTELLEDLDPTEEYTLVLLDTFGDGALDAYSITDLATGNEIAVGDWPTGDTLEIVLGSPTQNIFEGIVITPEEGDVDFPSDLTITVTIDADGALAGVYTTEIIITTNDPLNPEITVPVTVNIIAFPNAQFTANNDAVVCGVQEISFFDESVNDPTEWLWDFGDGSTSMDQNPTHTYTASGNYDVTLIASNDIGVDTLLQEAFIIVDTTCVSLPLPANGAATITACNGELFDSGGEDGNYAFQANGTLTIDPLSASAVTLTFLTFDYESGFDTLHIHDGIDASAPLIGSFTGIDLPNGGVITSTNADGALTLREVSDQFVSNAGFSAFFSCSIVEAAPEAAASLAVDNPCNGLYQFTDESLNIPTTWSWEFGDGGTSAEANPEHQYTASGNYDVVLTVTNEFGTDVFNQNIDVNVLDPQVVIPSFGISGEPIIFEGNAGVGYSWDFGDGGQSQFSSPPHTYTVAADQTFTVTVIVQDPAQGADCEVIITQEIEIVTEIGAPTANASSNSDNPCSGLVQFTDLSSQQPNEWLWDFGDGNTSTDENPSNQYSAAGSYDVSFTATNDLGSDSHNFTIEVNMLDAQVTIPNEILGGTEIMLGGNEDLVYLWNFGDGEQSNEAAGSHTYAESMEDYTVTISVTVSDPAQGPDCSVTIGQEVDIVTVVGLDDEAFYNSFQIYPNPANDGFVSLNYGFTGEHNFLVKLVDLTGRTLIEEKHQSTNGYKGQLNVNGLANGYYMIQLIDDNQQVSKRVFIQN